MKHDFDDRDRSTGKLFPLFIFLCHHAVYDCVLCIAMRALYRTLVKVYRDRRQDVAQEIERN